jgi:hypothetical protein
MRLQDGSEAIVEKELVLSLEQCRGPDDLQPVGLRGAGTHVAVERKVTASRT